jgi:hypothetical protein
VLNGKKPDAGDRRDHDDGQMHHHHGVQTHACGQQRDAGKNREIRQPDRTAFRCPFPWCVERKAIEEQEDERR